MATTPPMQLLASPATPTTPLHGAKYDLSSIPNLRRSTRSTAGNRAAQLRQTPEPPYRAPRSNATVSTPKPAKQSQRRDHLSKPALHSPEATPNIRATRRVQHSASSSPSSPDSHTRSAKQPKPSTSHLQPLTSSSTTISHGMLPTPVKTPRKKDPAHASATARVLFQDTVKPLDLASPEPTPRRTRKNKRHNGFTLESFSARDNSSGAQVEIYTDSRDRVPEVDTSSSNPFIERKSTRQVSSSQKVAGTSKRRKVSGELQMDTQVQEALDNDEGMVYTFRGKKVYRAFNDEGDEAEEIAVEDYASLGDAPRGSTSPKPLKTLTRKGITPTLLFPSEEQRRAREAEKEEEADTDIEHPTELGDGSKIVLQGHKDKARSSRQRTSKRGHLTSDESSEDHQNEEAGRSKNGSPFDTWPRVKSIGSVSASKGKKRGVSEVEGTETDGQTAPGPRKVRA